MNCPSDYHENGFAESSQRWDAPKRGWLDWIAVTLVLMAIGAVITRCAAPQGRTVPIRNVKAAQANTSAHEGLQLDPLTGHPIVWREGNP